MTLTAAQEFREARDWLAQNKRDPFLWLIILMPLTFATLIIGAPAILLSVFPFLDAKQALGQTLPNTDLVIVETRTLCKLPRGTYIFGYDFGVKTDKGHKKTLGRNAETLLTVDGFWLSEPKYKYLESRIAAQSRMPGLLWTRSTTLRSERTLTNTAATNLEL